MKLYEIFNILKNNNSYLWPQINSHTKCTFQTLSLKCIQSSEFRVIIFFNRPPVLNEILSHIVLYLDGLIYAIEYNTQYKRKLLNIPYIFFFLVIINIISISIVFIFVPCFLSENSSICPFLFSILLN